MRLPSYDVIRVPARSRGSVARRLKYASRGNPARGPGVRDDPRHPLDGHEHGDHSSGLQTPAMGTMHDRRGRYAAYTTRLVDGVLTPPGHAQPEPLRAVPERAFGRHLLSKPGTSAALSGTERGTGGDDHTGERERGHTGEDLLSA